MNQDDERVNSIFSVFIIGILMALCVGAIFGAIATYFFIK